MNAQPTRRFIVMTGSLTNEQQAAYNKALSALGVAWAHHTPSAYLVVAGRAHMNATSLRAMVGGVAPGVDCVVVEIGDVRDWAVTLNKAILPAATQWYAANWWASAPRD